MVLRKSNRGNFFFFYLLLVCLLFGIVSSQGGGDFLRTASQSGSPSKVSVEALDAWSQRFARAHKIGNTDIICEQFVGLINHFVGFNDWNADDARAFLDLFYDYLEDPTFQPSLECCEKLLKLSKHIDPIAIVAGERWSQPEHLKRLMARARPDIDRWRELLAKQHNVGPLPVTDASLPVTAAAIDSAIPLNLHIRMRVHMAKALTLMSPGHIFDDNYTYGKPTSDASNNTDSGRPGASSSSPSSSSSTATLGGVRAFTVGELLYEAPLLTNFWYTAVLLHYPVSLASRLGFEHLRQHLFNFHWLTALDEHMNFVFFCVSYIDPVADRYVKAHINALLTSHIQHSQRPSVPFALSLPHRLIKPGEVRPLRIAVPTQFWFRRHSIYRTFVRYARALRRYGFELDLLVIGSREKDQGTDEGVFSHIQYFNHPSDLDKAYAIEEFAVPRLYDAVFYPEVGMSWTSTFLANLRLAPVQFTVQGHSVSTFGTQIDYYFSGDETEPDVEEQAAHEFSETLVLIPGMGVVNYDVSKAYTPRWRMMDVTQRETLLPELQMYTDNTTCSRTLRIILNHASHKLNHNYLCVIAHALLRVARPLIEIHIFPFFQTNLEISAFKEVAKATLRTCYIEAGRQLNAINTTSFPPRGHGQGNTTDGNREVRSKVEGQSETIKEGDLNKEEFGIDDDIEKLRHILNDTSFRVNRMKLRALRNHMEYTTKEKERLEKEVKLAEVERKREKEKLREWEVERRHVIESDSGFDRNDLEAQLEVHTATMKIKWRREQQKDDDLLLMKTRLNKMMTMSKLAKEEWERYKSGKSGASTEGEAEEVKVGEEEWESDFMTRVSITVNGGMAYPLYMSSMSQHVNTYVEMNNCLAVIALEAFPFGGCNTVIDTLWAGIPTVTYEGKRFNARVGTAILRRASPTLAAALTTRTPVGFVKKVIQLSDDDDYRHAVQSYMRGLPLGSVFNSGPVKKMINEHSGADHTVKATTIKPFMNDPNYPWRRSTEKLSCSSLHDNNPDKYGSERALTANEYDALKNLAEDKPTDTTSHTMNNTSTSNTTENPPEGEKPKDKEPETSSRRESALGYDDDDLFSDSDADFNSPPSSSSSLPPSPQQQQQQQQQSQSTTTPLSSSRANPVTTLPPPLPPHPSPFPAYLKSSILPEDLPRVVRQWLRSRGEVAQSYLEWKTGVKDCEYPFLKEELGPEVYGDKDTNSDGTNEMNKLIGSKGSLMLREEDYFAKGVRFLIENNEQLQQDAQRAVKERRFKSVVNLARLFTGQSHVRPALTKKEKVFDYESQQAYYSAFPASSSNPKKPQKGPDSRSHEAQSSDKAEREKERMNGERTFSQPPLHHEEIKTDIGRLKMRPKDEL